LSIVYLGNTAPIETKKIDESSSEVERIKLDIKEAVTVSRLDDSYKLAEQLRVIVDAYDGYHSNDPPAWVESDSDSLALLIQDHYSSADHEVKIGRPEGWGESENDGGEE
jgi:hypothetical protein